MKCCSRGASVMSICVFVLVFVMSACASAGEPDPVKAGKESKEKGKKESPKETAGNSPIHNTLKWSTASEVENFGFDIYRSTSEDGDFERITSEPLPGGGTIDEPQHYEYKDFSIEPDTAYYYYIESISYAGVRERFSPIFRAPPKHQSE